MIAMILLWGATLLLGGSSRATVIQTVFLRPIAVLIGAFGVWTLRRTDVSRHRLLLTLAAAIVLLTASHAVPLPPGWWQALPGRGLIVDLDAGLGIVDAWRPLSMAPAYTWNALFSLSVPLAFLINGIQLKREELPRMIVVFVAGGAASALLAFLQMFGSPNGFLYLDSIRATAPEAVGFFANRNHQALLIASLFPLLAAYAAKRGIDPAHDRRRLVVALALGVFLIPLLIVAGSRAGLVAGLFGLASVPLVYLSGARVRRSRRAASTWWKYLLGVVVVLAIGLLSIFTDRSIAIQRAIASYSEEDQRYDRWSVILAHYKRFLPTGSGIGSYQPVFQTFEPRDRLGSSYSNHAHNDWLEVVMTAGVPGGLLLAVAILAFGWAVWRHVRARERGATAACRLAGLVILLLIGLASLVDYPLRAPITMVVLVMSCLWAGLEARAPENAYSGEERLG
jgi:O-antigen ligase